MMDNGIQNTGERLIPGDSDLPTFYEHAYRYAFACRLLHGLTILDIASGEGYGSFVLSQVAKSITGIDIDPASVRHATEKYGLDFRVGSAEKIPMGSAIFDAVVSFETIEHLPNPKTFLQEVFRVLKPGGFLLLSTPNKEVYHADQEANPFHCSELTLSELQEMLDPLFEVQGIYGQIFPPKCPLETESRENRMIRWARHQIKNKFWPDFNADSTEEAGRFVRRISFLSKPMDSLWNPYALRKLHARHDQKPKYLIVVAVKKE